MVKSNVNRGRERREHLRAQAQQLSEERSQRSPSQQLELLDKRLGIGVGAVKERIQLQSEIDDKKKSTRGQSKSRPPPSNKKGERRTAKSRRNAEREKRQRKST